MDGPTNFVCHCEDETNSASNADPFVRPLIRRLTPRRSIFVIRDFCVCRRKDPFLNLSFVESPLGVVEGEFVFLLHDFVESTSSDDRDRTTTTEVEIEVLQSFHSVRSTETKNNEFTNRSAKMNARTDFQLVESASISLIFIFQIDDFLK